MINGNRFTRAIAVAAIALLPAASRAQDIDTRNVDSYAYGGSGIYGQSFTVGSLTTLNSFSFWVGANDPRSGGVGAYSFYAQLFRYNGTGVVGSALYSSGVFSAACCDAGVPPRYDFNVGALALLGGQQYLALIARTTPGGLDLGYSRGPTTFIDAYAGGEFVGGVNAGVPDPAAAAYFPIAFVPGNDLMFVADFSQSATVVPEPSTFALLAVGALALVAVRRKRIR